MHIVWRDSVVYVHRVKRGKVHQKSKYPFLAKTGCWVTPYTLHQQLMFIDILELMWENFIFRITNKISKSEVIYDKYNSWVAYWGYY